MGGIAAGTRAHPVKSVAMDSVSSLHGRVYDVEPTICDQSNNESGKQCFHFRGNGCVSIPANPVFDGSAYTACVWVQPHGSLTHIAEGTPLTLQTLLARKNGSFEAAITHLGELYCVVNAEMPQVSERGSLGGSIYASASSKNLRQSVGGGIAPPGRALITKRKRSRYGSWCRTGIRLCVGAWAHVAWAVNKSAVMLYVDGVKR
jgi:hypothetical protein